MSNHLFSVWYGLLLERAGLTAALTRREIESRYRGTLPGRAWIVVAPLLMLTVYTFVFGHILKARWGADQDTASFALTLFSGLLLNTLLGESLGRAASVMHGYSNYVKKLVFPLEVIPLSVLFAGLLNALVGYLVLLVAMPLLGHPLGWSALYLPLALLPFLVCLTGLTFLTAALGTYFRDAGQIVQFVLILALFLSPILYPLTSLPEPARSYLALNPLTIPVETVRAVLFGSPLPPLSQIVAYNVVAGGLAAIGVGLFMRVKCGFADVL